MATISIEIPDEISEQLKHIADQLTMTPAECVQLALSHFLQTHVLESAMEGMARATDGEALVDFPEVKEELGLDIKFHPLAMEELESLSEEEQLNILEELIERITNEEEVLEDTLDLVLKEDDEKQMILSEFTFGDVVYQIGQTIAIYHIAILEEILNLGEEEIYEEDSNETTDGHDHPLEVKKIRH